MTATLYIIKDADGYRLGADPVIRLWEPESVSRTWIRRVTVELPNGYKVAENYYGEPNIYLDGEHYELGTDKNDSPVIIDHKNNGSFIRLPILEEGWGNEA